MRAKFYKLGFYALLFLFVYNQIKSRSETSRSCKFKTKLTHIIIPFHIKQLKLVELNIKKWKKYWPCEPNQNLFDPPKLIFYVGSSFQNELNIKNLVKRLGNLKESFECFSNPEKIEIATYEFTKEQDKHILGARLMFENCLKKNHELFRDINYMFYMEPDCRPIKKNWLIALQSEVYDNANFWMKGAFFRGDIKFLYENEYLPNKYHINGNSIYNLGSDYFADFYFKTLRPYIKRHVESITAYDTDISEFIMDKKNIQIVGRIIHNFIFTEIILNYWHTNYTVKDVNTENPNSYLVHSGQPQPNDW